MMFGTGLKPVVYYGVLTDKIYVTDWPFEMRGNFIITKLNGEEVFMGYHRELLSEYYLELGEL